jgi:hypothetical protein
MKTLFLICFLGLTFGSNAQENILSQKISIEFNQLTLPQAFQQMEAKYHIQFSYNPDLIDIEKTIQFIFKKEPLEQVLHILLKDYPVKWVALNNMIILTKNETNDLEIAEIYTIKGQVISQSQSKPIALVHIYIQNHFVGTVSDYDGFFDLKLKPAFIQDTLVFSAVGYNSHTSLVKELAQQPHALIQLVDSTYQLSEVEVKHRTKMGKLLVQINIFHHFKHKWRNFWKVQIPDLVHQIDLRKLSSNLKLKLEKILADLERLLNRASKTAVYNEKKARRIIRRIQKKYQKINEIEIEEIYL